MSEEVVVTETLSQTVERQAAEIERLRDVMDRVASELGRENEGLAQMIREALGE